MMRQSPGFTAAAILTLALGIGGNTAVFSVVHALLMRPLPLAEPERLMFIAGKNPARAGAGYPFSVAAYETMRDGTRAMDGIAAVCEESLTLTGIGDPPADPQVLTASRVSANFFDVVGVHPAMGRGFRADEGAAGAAPVAVISRRLWQTQLGGDRTILGRGITLGQEAYTVIGVMGAEFPFPYVGTDVWVTQTMAYTGLQPEQIRNGAGYLTAIARLRSGMKAQQASAELAVLARQYQRDHVGNPDADPRTRWDVTPLAEALVSDIRPTLLVLMGAVGFVLLIACANVAGLTLARASGRGKELAIRAAMGASRGTILRQLLMESVLLAVVGAAVGTVPAAWGVEALANASGGVLPGFQPVRVDLPVLGFTLAIAIATGVLCGVVPALRVSRQDLNAVLRDASRGTTGGMRRQRVRGLLVVGQMALSMVLLIGAGLLLTSYARLQNVDPGFDPRHEVTMRLSLPPARYGDEARRIAFVRDVVARVDALPGVQSAAISLALPLGTPIMAPFLAEGQATVAMGLRPLAVWNAVTPEYFRTLGIALVKGRDFTARDDAAAPKRVIVSAALARRFWPNEEALGKRILYSRRQVPAEIVGVAADVKTQGLEADAGLVMYTPYPQFPWANVALTLRAAGDPKGLFRGAREAVFAVDRDLPVVKPQTLEELVEGTLSQRRQTVYVVACFAVVALLLAAVGLYGVMAYTVEQRRAEIGIRHAIGARRGDILRMVLAQAVGLSAIGIGVGAVGAWALTRLIAQMLYRTSATDPSTYVGVAILFLAIAVLASGLPAWRAARVDAAEALRVG
jgi:putative ABC transport system permease protein